MKLPTKLAALATLSMTAGSAYAQGNPGGSVLWAAVAGAAVGFAVGYYVGKQSGKKDDDSKDKP